MSVRTWRTIGAIGIMLGLASLLITIPLQWVLSPGGGSPTSLVSAHRAAWTTMSLLAVFGPAVWITGIVTVTALARERGWVLATIGGLVTTVALGSGIGHLGIYVGLLGDLAGARLSERAVNAVLAADNANPVSSSLLLIFLVGFTLGPIVLTIGLRRARLVPVWLPVAAVIAGVANFMPGPAAGMVQMVALAATYVPLVVLLVREPGAVSSGEPSLGAPSAASL